MTKNKMMIEAMLTREAAKKVKEAIDILNGMYDAGLWEDNSRHDDASKALDEAFWTLSFSNHEEN